MKALSFLKLISIFNIIFAMTLILPTLVAIYYNEPYDAYLKIMTYILTLTIPIQLLSKTSKSELKRIDGFIVIVGTWVTLCLVASVPFYLILEKANLIDCIFEAISGLTTTGAEIFENIDSWPQSLKIYHQFLQFLGGLGIIILGIAVMPLLGQNVSTLIENEATKDQRLTPRINNTAKQLWKIYLYMLISSVLLYHFAGMPWFDAFSYGFTTFSTGGFGIYSDSLMHYHSHAINIIASFFALLGSLNFAIMFNAIKQRRPFIILSHNETKYLFKYILSLTLIIAILMLINKSDTNPIEYVTSLIMMITTAGLQISEFNDWPSFLAYLMLLASILGGASCSTTGGIKMHRVMLIHQEIAAMFKQILHPRAIKPSFQGINSNLIHGFLSINLLVYIISIMILIELGYSLDTAFASVTACLTNVGVTIGDLAHGYHDLSSSAKATLSVLMLIGRLEATTVLVILTPYFWREI